MNYGLQMLFGLKIYELWAENINGSANFHELWAPQTCRILWAANINGSVNFHELWAPNINGSTNI